MVSNLAVFFDVDNTLIKEKSMFSFMKFFLDEWLVKERGVNKGFDDFYSDLICFGGGDRLLLNRLYYRSLAGYSIDELSRAAKCWFDRVIFSGGEFFWIKESVDFLLKMKLRGYQVVAVSGSADFILAPIVDALSMDWCLCTKLELSGFVCTGEIDGRQMIGEGKRLAVIDFSVERVISLEGSWACGDHVTDLPMLEVVGNRCVVAGDPVLENIAFERGWGKVIRPFGCDQKGGVYV